jgi:hypothetical protein
VKKWLAIGVLALVLVAGITLFDAYQPPCYALSRLVPEGSLKTIPNNPTVCLESENTFTAVGLIVALIYNEVLKIFNLW